MSSYCFLIQHSSWTRRVYLLSCIYSIDILLYPYALPLISIPFTFSSLCLSATWARLRSLQQLLYWVTQENLIEISLQTNLPYILLTMVHAYYCAPYPKWPCVGHEVNICYPYCIISFVLEPSTPFSQVSWSMLWLHHQIVTVWPITSNPNPSCSKNRK